MSCLPNLFAGPLKSKHSQRLYEVLLARLSFARQSDRMLMACRDIRRFARKAGRKKAVASTYFWEMEAHGHRHDFEAMWRTLRAWEEASMGQRIKVGAHNWTHKEHHQLIFGYAPLLYLRGRYRLGCRLMEKALEMSSHRKGWSFESLWHVYKPLSKPSSVYDVTLAHFYTALGRELSEWELWPKFLDGLDAKLFQGSGIAKEALRKDSQLIKPFFEWVTSERRKRLFTGTTDGERDLVESPSKVRRRQSARKRELLKVDAAPARIQFEQKLLQLFPELALLPGLPSLKQLMQTRAS